MTIRHRYTIFAPVKRSRYLARTLSPIYVQALPWFFLGGLEILNYCESRESVDKYL